MIRIRLNDTEAIFTAGRWQADDDDRLELLLNAMLSPWGVQDALYEAQVVSKVLGAQIVEQ
jgi:hypothetical protein